MSQAAPDHSPTPPPGTRVAVVAARWNAALIDVLLDGCLDELSSLGVAAVVTHRVPGAYELPLAARWATGSADAVICLGCVIRGDTPHFDYVAGECARGIMDAQLATKVPIIFGVLTVNTEQQAWDRTGGTHGHAGRAAARAAAEMAALRGKLQPTR
jgi:6,7-dimethyl-8-ribityllumazine synthase